MGRLFRSFAAYLILVLSFGVALLVSRLGKAIGYRSHAARRCVVVTGTFHNPNWFRSHALPLARSGVDEVVFVTDEPQEALEGVRFACPPLWVSILMSRALAKMVWMVIAGIRYKPELYMGYHLFPGGLSALIVARLLGRPACYQMCGGPAELIGGGLYVENRVTSSLRRPSAFLQRLAIAVTREFDQVVVRGSKARQFLLDQGLNGRIAVIPGSVKVEGLPRQRQRCFDLIFVGRLTQLKQPLQFVEIVAAVRRDLPSIRAIVVGEGPLMSDMRNSAVRLGLGTQVELLGKRKDVEGLLAQSKVFVLTSRSEGLSIAMAEAMAAGTVPVVTDVGDLRDLVRDGVSGYVIPLDDSASFVRRVVALLEDSELWSRCSRNAAEAARRHNGVDVVAARWESCLKGIAAPTGAAGRAGGRS